MIISVRTNKKNDKKFHFCRITVFLIFSIFSSQALTACAIRNGSYKSPTDVDPVMTGAIEQSGQIAPQIIADSSALTTELNHLPTSQTVENKYWQNPDTGSSGVLSAFAEEPINSGKICRKFQATRDSYDGSALYEGKACKYRSTDWVLQSIEEK